MSTYCFILGSHPLLSIAEIWHTYGRPDFTLKGDFALVQLKEDFNQADLNRLGGSTKVAKVIQTVSRAELIPALSEALSHHYKEVKLDYGVSVYGFSESQLRPLLLKLKKQLKSKDLKSRFINHQFKNISAAQYKSIRNKGVELLVIKNNNEFSIAEVVAVQDIDAYSKRDYEKPKRNMQMGMMPPKLAQILINLTGVDGPIWDPFCGGGTLVMEGLLMGREMMGSDISSQHIEDAKTNIRWLMTNFQCPITNVKLFVHDATNPLHLNENKEWVIEDWSLEIKAIAFEGYLGDPHSQNISHDYLNKIIVQLTQLYVQFFHQLKGAEFKGPVVAALPYFILSSGQEIMMDRLLDQLKKMGFAQQRLLPESVKSKDPFCLKYSRKGQAVGRAIYKFTINT